MTTPSEKVIENLVAAAAEARRRAYAPYSGFAVGAAVLDTEGRVHVGCNLENASYGLTVCAERNALAAARVAGASGLVALAVVTDAQPPASPCGACRQVLAEFGEMPVILANPGGQRSLTSVSELLPRAFTPHDLERG